MEEEQKPVDWMKLDDITWHEILLFLDAKSLLRASESCRKFEELFSTSSKLLDKVKISLQFPENRTEDELTQLVARLKDHSYVTRNYQRLEILRCRDVYLNHNVEMRRNFMKLVGKLSESVKVLKIVGCNILRKDVISMLMPFKQMRECSIRNLVLSDDVPPRKEENFDVEWPNLKKLHLMQCDFLGLLLFQSNDKFESLSIWDSGYNRPDIVKFENFLLKQRKLKELRLANFRFNSSYSTDRLSAVPFQLKTLSFHNVTWDMTSHCEAFLKSQTGLKKLELEAFHRWITPYESNCRWFTSIMHHFLTKNPRLTSVTINTRFSFLPEELKDADFLTDVINTNVVELMYCRDREDKSEFFKILARMFPKLKTVTLFDPLNDTGSLLEHLQQFPDLETLKLHVRPKALTNLQLGHKHLKDFQFHAMNEEKSAEKLAVIFTNNPTIRNVSLNMEPLTIEEITGVMGSLAPTLETFRIPDLHLTPPEAEMFVETFPKITKIQSDFPLNPDAQKILAGADIRFEMINDKTEI